MRTAATLRGWLPHASAAAWTGLAALGPSAALLVMIRTIAIHERSLRLQSDCLTASIAMAALAGVALFGPKRLRTRWTTLAWVVGIGGLLVASAIVWNKLFLAHHLAGGTGHIFRRPFLGALRAPFYGFPMRPAPLWAYLSAALSVMLIVDLCRRPLASRSLRSLVASLLGFQIALTWTLAFAESPRRPFGAFSGYRDFSLYANVFDGAPALLREWVATMRQLSGFGNHYPPGVSFMLKVGGDLGLFRLVKVGFALTPALTVFPLLGLARELRLDEQSQKMIALVFATSATVLIFPTLTPTPSLMFPGTMAMWMLVRGLERGGVRVGVAMGLWMALFGFFSFAVYMVALPMACLLAGTIAVDRSKLRAGCVVVGSSLISFTAFFVLLYVATGFDMFACVNKGIRLTLPALYVSAAGFAIRNTGCLIAYLVSVGFPLATLALLAVGRVVSGKGASRGLRVFVAAVALGILLGASTGRTWLETERVWLFYTPLLALLGGWELGCRVSREGDAAARGVAVAALSFACSYGLFMRLHF